MVPGVVLAFLTALAPVAVDGATAVPAPRIPIALCNDKVILPVTVGDSRTLHVILDTGMSFEGLLLYNSDLLDSIPLANPVRASVGGAGSGPAPTALMADSMAFRVGEVSFPGQRVVILEGEPMKGYSSDGVCGYSLFGSRVVEMDYDRMEMVLHEPGSFVPDSSWTALPMTFRENTIPWIEVTASIAGEDGTVLSCYVDLASSETVEFLIRDGMKFTPPDGLEEVVLGRGLSGDIRGRRGTAAWVRLGPHRVEGIRAAFTPAEVRSRQPGADAVIGNGLLARFRCAFDYHANRLYLKPRDPAGR